VENFIGHDSNTAKADTPPQFFQNPSNCNTLEIPQAKQNPANDGVAKDGAISFSNIFANIGKPLQFNMMDAVESKPATNATAAPDGCTPGVPPSESALPNHPLYQFRVNQETLSNQAAEKLPAGQTVLQNPGTNDNLFVHQPNSDQRIPLLQHQDGEDHPLVGQIVRQPSDQPSHRLDCAKVVSDQLNQIDPNIEVTSNLSTLRNELTDNNWDQVSKNPAQFDPSQLQPGDVIAGTRQPGMPGHAAIYLGGGKIYNNNSNDGTGEVESVDKFLQQQYNKDGSFNKNGYSNVYVYRNASESYRQNEVAKLENQLTE